MDSRDFTELDALIEDLGLTPSTFLTPTLKDLISKEYQQREFLELNELEKIYEEEYKKRLSRIRAAHSKANYKDNSDQLILFPDGLFKTNI